MDTELLYEFLILSQIQNYSRAAEHLYISQSALSKHITKLEKNLGVKLFDRTTHGVALTEAGQLLAERTVPLLRSFQDSWNALEWIRHPVSGTVRIGCVYELSFASHIRIFVDQFSGRFPDIPIRFSVLTEGTPESILADGLYDILFTPCDFAAFPSYMKRSLIYSHSIYAAVCPGHRLLCKSHVSLSELSGETLLVPYPEELFGPYARNWLLTQKLTRGTAAMLPVQNVPTTLFEVQRGQGIALLPRYVRSLLPNDLSMIAVSTDGCRYPEYIYRLTSGEDDAPGLFYSEFLKAYLL